MRKTRRRTRHVRKHASRVAGRKSRRHAKKKHSHKRKDHSRSFSKYAGYNPRGYGRTGIKKKQSLDKKVKLKITKKKKSSSSINSSKRTGSKS